MKLGVRSQKLGVGRIFCPILFSILLTQNSAASIQRYSCPTDVETLTTLMLRDLPSYANRVSSSSNRITSPTGTYVILAGKAEFAPLSLGPGEYTPDSANAPPQQVFFTTLERQYTARNVTELQEYHWLFLVQTNSGWRFVMMFSQTGSYPGGRPPTAPRDSSNGVIGRGVQIWLRDCRAGVIRPL